MVSTKPQNGKEIDRESDSYRFGSFSVEQIFMICRVVNHKVARAVIDDWHQNDPCTRDEVNSVIQTLINEQMDNLAMAVIEANEL